MTPFIQSVLSVLGAFFVVAVLVGLTTTITAQLMLGPDGPGTEPTTAFLAVNLTSSVLFPIVGGYVAATVSDHSPLRHAAALSVFMILVGLTAWMLTGRQPAPGRQQRVQHHRDDGAPRPPRAVRCPRLYNHPERFGR